MKLSIAICDDEYSACEHIRTLLQQYEFEYDFDFEISTFTDATLFLESYAQPATYDVVFLDVEMSTQSGLLVAQTIRNLPDYDVKIIFVSNYPKYMQDSFNVSAFQYIQKPITKQQLHHEFSRLVTEFMENASNVLVIAHDDTEEVVPLRQILYIENIKHEKNKLRYVCKNETIIGLGSISDLEKNLINHRFRSPHRGILINMAHIHFIAHNEIEMINQDKIPLSRRREREFRDYFNKQLL